MKNMKYKIIENNIIYFINDLFIPSRYFLAPINTGFANNGVPNSNFVEFYQKRSGNEIGITYIGNIAIGAEWITNQNTPWISPDSLDWERISSIILKNGSLPGIQLACRLSDTEPLKAWRKKNIKKFMEMRRKRFLEISRKDIENIIRSFIDSAELAIKYGFKVIQFHAAHGYFLAQLLDNRFNLRGDIFGSDPLSFIKLIISEIRMKHKNIIIDIRISLLDGIEDGRIEYKRKCDLIESLFRAGLDIISISNGIYDLNKSFIYPPKSWGHGPFVKMVIPLAKRYPDILWNVAGNIWDIRRLPKELPNNMTFSIARSLIADPEMVKKQMTDNFKNIYKCSRRGDCHYYIRGRNHISCPLEPSLIFKDDEMLQKC